MNFRYQYELPLDINEEMMMTLVAGFLGVICVVLVIALILWIIRSASLYAIANRRGLRSPWLSWLPIGTDWILGSIADQYQHLACGKVTSRRKILTVLKAAQIALVVYSGVMYGLLNTGVLNGSGDGSAILSTIISLLTWGVNIAALVYYHICNFDLYRSCNPDNAAVYLIVGLLLGVTEPFFYLVNRKKDKGFIRPEPQPPVEY